MVTRRAASRLRLFAAGSDQPVELVHEAGDLVRLPEHGSRSRVAGGLQVFDPREVEQRDHRRGGVGGMNPRGERAERSELAVAELSSVPNRCDQRRHCSKLRAMSRLPLAAPSERGEDRGQRFEHGEVDGVYDDDPKINPNAVKFETIPYIEALNRRLKVLDSTAISLCMDNNLPILVLNLWEGDSLVRAVQGEKVGTVIGR